MKPQRIFITGGSSGIGKATLELLKQEGAQLAFCGLEENLVKEVSQGLEIPAICVNLSTEDGVLEAHQFAEDCLGGIDVLINNAGGALAKPFEALTRADFEYMYALNAIAPARLSQLVLPHFRQKGQGDIINIGATGAHYGFKTGTAYASSKSALANISKCMATELREHNIRVMHIDPSRAFDEPTRAKGQLTYSDIAQMIVAVLKMERNAFVPEMSVWATNPF